MSLIPTEAWYRDRLKLVQEEHGATQDRIGRPWYQHFERVALRLMFRCPGASQAQIEAALMHDALMAGGKGRGFLEEIGLLDEAIEIIELITPPPHGNFFRDFEAITAADNAIYLAYIRGVVASGNKAAIHVKLADIRDTIEAFQAASSPVLKGQLRDRYQPSVDLLAVAVETLEA
ncbi:hypothetical protein [Bradyrhizobium sp. LHD-71]|uniref:hypothetical protein n=1 Tax=Bradyrhizobium sp. LHD-71 TaxID=3072141 RepID=UPI00280D27D5|nr:hypothetical protein [Bradyrhizobium sp. LHD-71]MDQ8729053.1 hypothetical protein [Bradyrhizobium sp. LHD-71]